MSGKPVCRSLPWLFLIISIGLMVLALGAELIGIDADLRWGPVRKSLLALGITGVLLVVLNQALSSLDALLLTRRPRSVRLLPNSPPSESINASTSAAESSPSPRLPLKWSGLIRNWGSPILAVIVVCALYVGQISAWTWSEWPNESSTYELLADAFLKGQTALLIEPPIALTELEDPYPFSAREGVPFVWDSALFNGKYYLYWGPAPAAFVALWKLIFGGSVGDEHITFVSASILGAFSILIIYRIRASLFPTVPRWLFILGIILVVTAYPILWILSWPSIYPAAIAAGQAFLITGLFFALPVWDSSQVQHWRLALVGLLWGLALASRLSLLGAVGILSIATAIALLTSENGLALNRQQWSKVIALASPLVICVCLLGIYNYVRFGSFFDTGYGYLLTGFDSTEYLEKSWFFNTSYLLPNIMYNFFTPFTLRPHFPFFRAQYQGVPIFSSFLNQFGIPEAYSVEIIAGAFFVMPALLFSGYLLYRVICDVPDRLTTQGSSPARKAELPATRSYLITTTSILFAALFTLIPLLLFFRATLRFHLDFVPLLSLAAVVGMWLFVGSSLDYPIRRRIQSAIVIVLVVASSIIGFLIGLSGADSGFDDQNPALYYFLVEFFSW